MQQKIDRAKELVPTIILTVLSMIQALALEFFWTQASGLEVLWELSWDSTLAWLQVIAVLDGILLIWIAYVNFVLRFVWLPSLQEMIMPFFIGVIEFGMIELLHPDKLGPWLVLLALAFAATVYSGFLTTRAARREEANAYFFDSAEQPSWRNYRESMVAVVLLVLLGLLVWVTTSAILSLVALLVSIGALTYQLIQVHKYWLHSLPGQ